jgi:hypothetical protein
MRNPYVAFLLAINLLLALSAPADAEVLNLATSKLLLQKKNETISMIVQPIDADRAADKKYVAQANRVNNAYKACLNPGAPPVGSPVYRFYKYKSPQLGDYCDKLSVQQCIDKVHDQQVAYCRQAVKQNNVAAIEKIQIPEPVEKVEIMKTIAGKPVHETGSAHIDLKRLTDEKSALEARKKKLESEIISIFGELAANEAEISKARKEVEREREK